MTWSIIPGTLIVAERRGKLYAPRAGIKVIRETMLGEIALVVSSKVKVEFGIAGDQRWALVFLAGELGYVDQARWLQVSP